MCCRWCCAGCSTKVTELDPIIRAATESDRDAIGRLYLQLKQHHHSLVPEAKRYSVADDDWVASIEQAMDDVHIEFFVAEDAGSVIAFMRLRIEDRPWGRACELDTIVVDESRRTGGVGRYMMEYAERIALGRGVTGMRVNVLAGNDRGRGFYEDLGYGVVALRYGKELSP